MEKIKEKPDNSLTSLDRKYREYAPQEILAGVINDEFKDEIALISSFGAESAVLLHMATQISPDIPVIFINTGKLFPETLVYRDELVKLLGLTNVKTVLPTMTDIRENDPDDTLWESDPDKCCMIRKILPLKSVIRNYSALINGRKRYHGWQRINLPLFEQDGTHTKINPLAYWSYEQIEEYRQMHNLPEHPLVKQGYTSIGCVSCTSKPCVKGDVRSGRWPGLEKSECGIDFLYKENEQ